MQKVNIRILRFWKLAPLISALTIVAKNISNSEGRLVPFIPRGSFSEKTKQIRTEGRHLDNLMIQVVRMGNAGVWSNDPGDIPGDDFSLLTNFRLMSRVGSRGQHPES